MEYLKNLENSAFSNYILGSTYAYQLLLVAHSVGMAMVVGIVLMLDLRVLGFPKGMSLEAFDRLLTLAWVGFLINAASGLAIFATDATKLIVLWTFQLKMTLIIVGGWSVWLLWRSVEHIRGQDAVFSSRAKLIAVISALFWIGAITSGRFIAYTLPPDL